MNRQELFKVADAMKLEYPKNIAGAKLKEKIEAKLHEMNGVLVDPPVVEAAPKAKPTPEKKKGMFCGYHPITKKPIYK